VRESRFGRKAVEQSLDGIVKMDFAAGGLICG
jgi:hypothetical protein